MQGETESIHLFIAAMEGLYGRLATNVPEEARLRQMYHNLNPQLRDRLALFDVTSIEQLRKLGRKAEAGRFRSVEQRNVHRDHDVMEPDLAYTPVRRRPTRDAAHPQPDRKIFQTARQADAEHKWPSFGKRGRGKWKRRHDTPQVEDHASKQPQKATLTIRSNTKKDVTARKEIRTVPIVRELVDELVAIGQIENAEGKVFIDTGAQLSLLKRGASSSDLLKSDVVLREISGKVLKTYGRQRLTLNLKPGVQVPGDFVVGNLPKGYLAVLGCDILGQGNGEISV
ncbi:hypothetical protein J6590_062676 [Homalodisca vitripennis]|nr:hypothetical protein J6590_062676 [Homalodisca vitripennis]